MARSGTSVITGAREIFVCDIIMPAVSGLNHRRRRRHFVPSIDS